MLRAAAYFMGEGEEAERDAAVKGRTAELGNIEGDGAEGWRRSGGSRGVRN